MKCTKHRLGEHTFFAIRESNTAPREWLVTPCLPAGKDLPDKPGDVVHDEISGETVVKRYGKIFANPNTEMWLWTLTPGNTMPSKETDAKKALTDCLDALKADRQSQVAHAKKGWEMERLLNDHATHDSRDFNEVDF